ncbi:MAG TPA: hypothetical protein VNA17_09115 [Pyrinomonadaceae bacterium]|nr:hypothetical protein [Pyrinomonadaceae bacterium]
MAWQSRTKTDLIIEVWEKLDCESVGAAEIEAISVAVDAEYGAAAVDPPMVIARLLADEGAVLRHAEIMRLHVDRASDGPYDAALRNLVQIDDLDSAASSIRKLENLRRKYKAENDRDGLRLVLDMALRAKKTAAAAAARADIDAGEKIFNAEISAWLTVWLQTPDIFDSWLDLRRDSADYRSKFG